MLDLYDSIYLKPQTGRFGNGIQKIEKTSEGYLYRGKFGAKKLVMDVDTVFSLIKRYKQRKYLIQQAISASFQGRPVDFRVILQKDGSQKWTCSGIIAKIGCLGRINTNNASSLELGREALQTVFGLTLEQAMEKEKEIIGICTEACQIIEDAYGYYGDVGIDVMLDDKLKVWVLEINKSHQHEMPKLLKDPDMYQRVVTRPLEYARVLAGF